MITKRCFICGSKENAGQCTNTACPRNAIPAEKTEPTTKDIDAAK